MFLCFVFFSLFFFNLICDAGGSFEFNILKVGEIAVNLSLFPEVPQMAPGDQLELAEGRTEEILPPNERPVFPKNQ